MEVIMHVIITQETPTFFNMELAVLIFTHHGSM